MPNGRSFKSDTSFLQKLAIGSIGTKQVHQDLARQSHKPIELERGSTNYKVWKAIKIKRIRLPDILCLTCGIRVESRAKTNLEISMSHSASDPSRGWDAGLSDSDHVALVRCEPSGPRPVDWRASDLIQYVSVKALRYAYRKGLVVKEKVKGFGEGFELRLSWPCALASSIGQVSSVSKDHVKYIRDAGRTTTIRLLRGTLRLAALVKPGDRVSEGQIIASVVPVTGLFPCGGKRLLADYIKSLNSSSLTERYAAIKAVSHFPDDAATTALLIKTKDEDEDIFVKLDAAAGLMQRGNQQGKSFLANCLKSEYLAHRLEAVIVLGERKTPESRDMLLDVLADSDQHAEIRAGAAWALGELGDKQAINGLVSSFLSVDESVRVEAARALAKLALTFRQEVLRKLPSLTPDARPGVAWAIGKAGGFTVKELLGVAVDDDARQWIAYMLGFQKPDVYLSQVEELKSKDPEVYFATTLLWKILSSWIANLDEY